MEELLLTFGNYGFPMVVAAYLLVRLEPLIRELQQSVALLTVVAARQGRVDLEQARRIVEGGR
jgi:hypothetical protein